MKKKTPYLDLYNEWMKTGYLPNDGLCSSIPKRLKVNKFRFIEPTDEDLIILYHEGKSIIYWGCDIPRSSSKYTMYYSPRSFNPLRQNLTLLCAALNNEL